MAIVIRSTFSRPDRPARQLEPGEFEAYTAKLKAAYREVVGRDLPDPPIQQFFELIGKFSGECVLSRSTWDYGAVGEETIPTGRSIVTTAIMTAVAVHHEQFLAEDSPWTLLLNPEFNLTRYLLATDRSDSISVRRTASRRRLRSSRKPRANPSGHSSASARDGTTCTSKATARKTCSPISKSGSNTKSRTAPHP